MGTENNIQETLTDKKIKNTNKEKPVGNFADAIREEPLELRALGSANGQKVQLFVRGQSIGWLGEDSNQWCIVVSSEEEATSIIPYVHNEKVYYRNTKNTSRYLSVSDGSNYVGFYNWLGATAWELKNGMLISEYTKKGLDYWSSDDNYVYANGGLNFTPLIVKFS